MTKAGPSLSLSVFMKHSCIPMVVVLQQFLQPANLRNASIKTPLTWTGKLKQDILCYHSLLAWNGVFSPCCGDVQDVPALHSPSLGAEGGW